MSQYEQRRRPRTAASANRQQRTKSAYQRRERKDEINVNSNQWVLPERDEDPLPNTAPPAANDEQNQPVRAKQPARVPLTPYDKVVDYLRKNSLVARGLTIHDVLHATSVEVKKPSYIQVIDRYVLAKVWDSVFPMIHASDSNKLRHVDHYASDLVGYEGKLNALIGTYNQFASRFISDHLPEDEKRGIAPHMYWIQLPTGVQNTYAQEISKELYTDHSKLEQFAWRKLTADQQAKLAFLEKPMMYNETTQALLKRALKEAGAQSALDGIDLIEVEIHRAVKFLQISTDIRRYQKNSAVEPKPKPPPVRAGKPKRHMSLSFGHRILCCYDGDGYLYPGTLQTNDDNEKVVLFDMDIEQKIGGRIFIPIAKLIKNETLYLVDCVLVRQSTDKVDYWVPGLVIGVPQPFSQMPSLYLIQTHDPDPKLVVYAYRRDLIRITVAIFHRAVLCRRNILTKRRPSVESEPPEPPSTVIGRPGSLDLDVFSTEDMKAILNDSLDPIKKRMEDLNISHDKSYRKLRQTLEDQMNALKKLQEKNDQPRPDKSESESETIPIEEQKQKSISTSKTEPPVTVVVPQSEPPPRPPPPIQEGTMVYAAWRDDDGLVYKGKILKHVKPDSYEVERTDIPGITSVISHHDIFHRDTRIPSKDIDAPSYALIKYPDDIRRCWCPAKILSQEARGKKIKIEFYDSNTKHIDHTQLVIGISKEQYDQLTTLRRRKVAAMVDKVIVGFHPAERCFLLGTIRDLPKSGHQYPIAWCTGANHDQEEGHLFGDFFRRDPREPYGYVVAMDEKTEAFHFGQLRDLCPDHKRATVKPINARKNGQHSPANEFKSPLNLTFAVSNDYAKTILALVRNESSLARSLVFGPGGPEAAI